MSLITYATIADLKLALRVYEGEFKVGTATDPEGFATTNLWEDSGTNGTGAVGTFTDLTKTWTPNFIIGAWLQDSAAKNFRVTSNSANALALSLCLDDKVTSRPADGAYLVSKLGYYLSGAIARISSALAAVYVLPLAGTWPQVGDLLRDIAVNLAVYNVFAHSYRNSSPAGGGTIPEIIRDQFKDANDMLAEVLSLLYPLKGEIRIGGGAIAMPRYVVSSRLFSTIEDLDMVLESTEDASPETSLGGIPSIGAAIPATPAPGPVYIERVIQREIWTGSGQHLWENTDGSWDSEAWTPSVTITIKYTRLGGVNIYVDGQKKVPQWVTWVGSNGTLPEVIESDQVIEGDYER